MRPVEMPEALTLRAPHGVCEALSAKAKAAGISRSELVRRAVAAYLAPGTSPAGHGSG